LEQTQFTSPVVENFIEHSSLAGMMKPEESLTPGTSSTQKKKEKEII